MKATQRNADAGQPLVTRFAQVLRARRAALGLSQAELADMLGVRTQTISHWERAAKTPQPRFDEVLVELLDLTGRDELRNLQRQTAPLSESTDEAAIGDLLPFVHRGAAAQETAGFPRVGTGARAVDPASFESAALAIINARGGSLSQVEADIVRTLLGSAGRLQHQ